MHIALLLLNTLSCQFHWQSTPYELMIEQDPQKNCSFMTIREDGKEIKSTCEEVKTGTMNHEEIKKSEEIRFLLSRSHIRPNEVQEMKYYSVRTDDDGGGFFLFDLTLINTQQQKTVGGITYMGGAYGTVCN